MFALKLENRRVEPTTLLRHCEADHFFSVIASAAIHKKTSFFTPLKTIKT
jgi:hypothetical protein